MSAQVFEIPDQTATLLEIMQAAQARGMHLIHNGREIVVSPIVPPGWWRVAAVFRDQGGRVMHVTLTKWRLKQGLQWQRHYPDPAPALRSFIAQRPC